MPLIECPECRKDVSDKAAACPHCGHPIAGYGDYDPAVVARAKRLLRSEPPSDQEHERKKKGGWGCGLTIIVVFVVGLAIIVGNQDHSDQSGKPTCKSDWHLCADNADLINNFNGILQGQAYCKVEANKLAKYGSPTWPWLAFSTFYKGNDYVKTGVVTLVEKDAQFSNAFGAMVHSTVTCRYDLNRQKVLDANVAAN